MTDDSLSSNSRDQRDENNDPVWLLLGKSRLPEPDPWFAVRTFARCRLTEGAESPTLILTRVWRWALGSGLGICLVLLLVTRPHAQVTAAAPDQKCVQEAFEIMAAINPDSDNTTPSSDSASWQDSSL